MYLPCPLSTHSVFTCIGGSDAVKPLLNAVYRQVWCRYPFIRAKLSVPESIEDPSLVSVSKENSVTLDPIEPLGLIGTQ